MLIFTLTNMLHLLMEFFVDAVFLVGSPPSFFSLRYRKKRANSMA
jgi:hypothetical protein